MHLFCHKGCCPFPHGYGFPLAGNFLNANMFPMTGFPMSIFPVSGYPAAGLQTTRPAMTQRPSATYGFEHGKG